ncbi:unnamed protein product [Sympodiomycopsis kandeliae]
MMTAEDGEKMVPTGMVTKRSRRGALLQTDLLLLPLLTLAFGMQFYDKAVLGAASIFGILPALDLQTIDPVTGAKDLSRYSLATACFYYGYIGAVIPMALLAQRIKIAYFLGTCITIWGIIVILTPVVSSWQGLCVQRVFLGVVESSVSPGFILITRQWYTKAEMPFRVGIWSSATGLFSILSGLINYGIGTHHQGNDIDTWKVLFLVPGAMTIFTGVAFFFILPNSPFESPLLRIPGYNVFEDERRMAIMEKTKAEMLGSNNLQSRWKWSQVIEALIDPKIWLYTFMATTIYICNGGVTTFGPIIIKSIGYSSTKAILLQTPGGATTVISILVVCLLSIKFKEARLVLLCISCIPVLIGAAMIWGSSWNDKGVPLAGYYLIPIFGAPYVMLLSSAAANVAGSTKSTFTSGAIFVGYNAGNIAAAYILKPSEAANHYPTTWKIIIAMMIVTMGLAGLLAAMFFWQNKKRNTSGTKGPIQSSQQGDVDQKQRDSTDPSFDEKVQLDEQDLTDWENKRFRYVY